MNTKIKIALVASVASVLFVASALCQEPPQTSPTANPGSFIGSVQSYFTSFNTNLDDTFGTAKGEFWVGADSLQGQDANLANSIGFSSRVWKAVEIETVTRNSGIAGVILSEQIGFSLGFVVHDTKLSAYADGGYALADSRNKGRMYGEFGLRVRKALTAHTYAGVGIGAQFPRNSQIATAFTGFTF